MTKNKLEVTKISLKYICYQHFEQLKTAILVGGASLSQRLIVTFSQISNSAQNSSFVTDQAWKWNIENFGKFRAANQGHIISDIKLRIIFNCHPPHHYKIFLTNKLWAGTWAECVTEWTWNMTALSYIISQITDTYIPNIIL